MTASPETDPPIAGAKSRNSGLARARFLFVAPVLRRRQPTFGIIAHPLHEVAQTPQPSLPYRRALRRPRDSSSDRNGISISLHSTLSRGLDAPFRKTKA